MLQRQYKQSLVAFEKALSAASYYEEVYYQAALAALGTGDTKKTVHYLMNNLRLHPYHLEAYELLATLLYETPIYAGEDELAMLERGLSLFTYDTSLWIRTGEILQKQGNMERAKDVYVRGLTVDTLSRDLLGRLEQVYPSKQEQPAIMAQARTLQGYQEKTGKFAKMSAFYQHKLREQLEAYV